MSRAVILQQCRTQGPGRIVPVLRDFGIPTEVRHLYKGDEVPTDLDELRMLVLLGGPMGVSDVGRRKVSLAWRRRSRRSAGWWRRTGPCWGSAWARSPGPRGRCEGISQCQARSHSRYAHNAHARAWLGGGDVSLPRRDRTDRFWNDRRWPMFHWHFDTFDLPKLPPPPNAPPPPAPPPPTGNALLSSTEVV